MRLMMFEKMIRQRAWGLSAPFAEGQSPRLRSAPQGDKGR